VSAHEYLWQKVFPNPVKPMQGLLKKPRIAFFSSLSSFLVVYIRACDSQLLSRSIIVLELITSPKFYP